MRWEYVPVFFAVLFIILIGIYYILDPETNELNEAERARLGGAYIKLSDGFTHYELDGKNGGGLVVLVHGGRVPMWTWDKLAQSLKDAGFKVLRYDMYGRGYSDRPKVTYSRGLYQRQLLELIDALGLAKKFDLIGFSLGGATAVNFTAQHPERIAKLVLIAPVINNFKVPSVFRIPLVGEFAARLFGVKIITKRFVASRKDSPEAEKYINLFREQTTYKGFQQSMLSMIRNDALVGDYSAVYSSVGKQKRDVLLIWGTGDKEVTEPMIGHMHSLIPHIEFRSVEGAGHSIVFQKPDEVGRFILQFLKS